MANFQSIQYSNSDVTAIAIDQNSGDYLWIAFALKSGTCRIQKVSAHDITQVFFTLELPVTSINCMKVVDDLLFVGVTHVTYAVYVYSVATPLSQLSIFLKSELSILEAPIAITGNATDAYILTPGSLSGEEAKIVRISNSVNYEETINLTESAIVVSDAVSVTINSNDDLWVITSGTPSILYRVFYDVTWQLQETELP